MPDPESIIEVAEGVARILEARGVGAVVIGGVALAAHRYVRFTDDLDLAVSIERDALHAVADAIRGQGHSVAVRDPDLDDPLGGVMDVTGRFGQVQVINYGGRFPAVIDDALREATQTIRPGSPLRLVPLPHLVALKLYAGGHKSKADIAELLRRNPEIDVDGLRKLCRRYRLPGLDELLRDEGLVSP
ncbi:MAG: nucleotidyl transferase AbiEii/AbiGii toxin family protein [Verrucomicrobiae bacterium]|nr:nucleotidyl transferase AbiEii/AbiGii toxin family protein [Verrucomicrobiae bacterium]